MPAPTNPTAGDVHVNAPLTNFSVKYMQDATTFVATRAMPNLPVGKQSDLYWEFNRGDWFRDEAEERADGSESAGGQFQVSTNPYFARVYAFHKDVTDRQRANADSQIRLDRSATDFVTLKMLIKREVLFASTFMGTSIWDDDVDATWNAASADPIVDIRTGMRTMQAATGFRPNRLLFGQQAWDLFVDHDAVLARVIGGATTETPARVVRRLIAELLEIDNVEVMGAIKNSAVRGEAESNAFIGSTDDVLLYYAPMAVAEEEPTAGVAFSWTGYVGATDMGSRISRFRMQNIRADRVEGEMSFDQKVIASDLGYYLHSVSDAS
jgi:hypothetical protein|tara:strand:+ start:29771 stop:30742 length:972 start_codon:yes stop_codon:yes gene_type:complete